ncbi:hypothetical protein EJB05_41044 [Eragrostis curvula]|uniref:DUF659 domain-containing protein n=1 Tax=Eragrostis curvula TaxID=38414 RepID=A0A5J9T8N3_9POAL|nr:hypothetical protein EJB05_41044 [Eragrostis curvula]
METTKTNYYGISCGGSSSKKGGQTSKATNPQYQNGYAMNKQAEIPSSQEINSGNFSTDNAHLSQMHESEMEATDNLDSLVANSIGRLIFEAGLEPEFIHLPSFEGVFDLLTRGVPIAMPTYEDILQVQLKEVQQRERDLKQQWERNGCSLVLDRWTSRCGKNFISVLVHCSQGMQFIRSMDVSTIIDDVDELASMVCQVVDEIGIRNIVQIIINDASPYMQVVEHAVLKKYDHSFSITLCADYCINLMLEDIAALDYVNEVLVKARRITRFIYGHALPMELKGHYIPGGEVISSSNLKYVATFVTLENLVSQRANLVEMFSSQEWTSSDLASTNLSRNICEIIQSENAFWCAAADVLKITGPLINVLFKLETDKSSISVLYDAMDNAKEEIKESIGHNHNVYWKKIDNRWDNYLHSPLHAAGYSLNPRVYYSDRFCYDTEINSGMLTSILRLAKSHHDAKFVSAQFDLYQRKSGLFGSDTAGQEAMEMPLDLWWSKYGADTPELRCFANRILSLTCFGASRYNIDNSLSERLHSETRSYPDQERFRKMEYIHYNLRLRNSVPRLGGPCEAVHGKLTTKLGDWISA